MATIFVSQIVALTTISTKAGTYNAICDDEKKELHEIKFPKPFLTDIDDPVPIIPDCVMELVINAEKITDPYKSISTSRVKNWTVTGSQKRMYLGK